jgi:hypothetical protein
MPKAAAAAAAKPTSNKKLKPTCPSPWSALTTKLSEVTKRQKADGSILIVGYECTESEQEDENGEADANTFTQAEVDTFRFVVVPPNRKTILDQMKLIATDGQEGFMMFNTAHSYYIIPAIEAQVKIAQKKSPADCFDHLFGLTFFIDEFDCWINDNEDADFVQHGVSALATAWKKVLAKTDEALGIDPEFTRPAIVALLQRFQKKLKEAEGKGFKFKFS